MTDNTLVNPNQRSVPCGYYCPKCRQPTFWDYRPYCGDCGARMPSQSKLELTGFVIYANDYLRPVRDADAIRDFLESVGVTKYWLHMYRTSTSEIRFSALDSRFETHALYCALTERLRLPTGNSGWQGKLSLFGDSDQGCRLSDVANDVEVCARGVTLYEVCIRDFPW